MDETQGETKLELPETPDRSMKFVWQPGDLVKVTDPDELLASYRRIKVLPDLIAQLLERNALPKRTAEEWRAIYNL